MKIRVFNLNDEVKWTVFPWNKKIDSETDEEFMDRMSVNHKNFIPELKTAQYIDMARDEFPHPNYAVGEEDEMLYFDGEVTKENLKKDINFDIRLMSDETIRKKILKKEIQNLDIELEKQAPDPIKILKIQRKIEKLKKEKDSKVLAQLALDGLNERVAHGESDKPIIRQKLQAKISELS